ncbi:predicted protein [Postia placenta Mad-698-R]|nr:predicted protein [Postia placenta Mad-698-R]
MSDALSLQARSPVTNTDYVYARQLFPCAKGLPLYWPEPNGNATIAVGDVGFFYDRKFVRLFNALRNANDPVNGLIQENCEYKPFDRGNDVKKEKIRSVKVEEELSRDGETWEHLKFRSMGDEGAFILLADPATEEYLVPSPRLYEYIHKQIKIWMPSIKKENSCPIDDVIFVLGDVKTSAWAFNVFLPNSEEATISINSACAETEPSSWAFTRVRPVDPKNECDQSIFMHYCRMKRRAPPPSDAPNNEQNWDIKEHEVVILSPSDAPDDEKNWDMEKEEVAIVSDLPPDSEVRNSCWNNGANGAGARLSTGVAMPVRDNRVRGLRPPATRAPELASSFLTARDFGVKVAIASDIDIICVYKVGIHLIMC